MYPNRLTKLDLRNCFQEKHAFAPGEDDEEDEEGQDDEGDGSSGTGASDGDDADASGKGKKPVKDPEKQKASREAARYRTELRAAQKEREELAKKLQEIEDKDKSELELKTRDLAAAQAQVEKMTQEIDSLRLEVAFFKSGAAALLNKPAQAVKLMDLSRRNFSRSCRTGSRKMLISPQPPVTMIRTARRTSPTVDSPSARSRRTPVRQFSPRSTLLSLVALADLLS
jgi:hypothetical protein